MQGNELALFVDGVVKDVILLRTGEHVSFTQKEDKLIVDTKNFPLYNMKYADCLKITF